MSDVVITCPGGRSTAMSGVFANRVNATINGVVHELVGLKTKGDDVELTFRPVDSQPEDETDIASPDVIL